MNTRIEKEHPFAFSVVMAVYNVEPFLREAVDSLIAQDFGFENIQLIMVDDGSTDGSGAICDAYAARYPQNVQVIHKENGGVSSARNEGLKYAAGRYLNFMDSDDKFTTNAFSNVYNFFIENEGTTDVVTIPLEFFDAQRGEHWQNDKFKKGTRVLDLHWDYQATVMFVNASFFAHRLKESIEFDSHLVCGEDMKVLLTVLIQKMKLGVVTGCKYMYRRRSVGEASLIQASKKKYGWYFDYFTYLIDWAVDYYRNHFGYLPAFVQYELLADLQWRFGQVYDMSEVLTAEEIERYKERLFSSLRYFDDKYILEQKKIWNEHKCYMLSKKHGCPPTLTKRDSNVIVHFGNTQLASVADQYSRIEFIRIQNGAITIEGYSKIFGVDLSEPLNVFLKCSGEIASCEILPRDAINDYRFGDLIFRGVAFRGSIPLNPDKEQYRIQLVMQYRGIQIVKRNIRYGTYAPISQTYASSYYCKDGWAVQPQRDAILLSRCGRRGQIRRELRFLKELWRKNALGGRKAVAARLLYHLCRPFKRKPLWLISDRIMAAGDNGEALFRYVREQHRDAVKAVFVVSDQSPDYARMRQVGPVVSSLSYRHKLLHLLCDCNISSHAEHSVINPLIACLNNYRDITSSKPFVFLQHGVIQDDLSGWLNRYNKNIRVFITSATPEYQSIIDGKYDYSAREVFLTGLPRFDRLYQDEQRCVTFVPTWRMYLLGSNTKTGTECLKSDFRDSDFFRFYDRLLRDERLLSSARQLNYRLQLMPHPRFQPYLATYELPSQVEMLGTGTQYRDVYAHSNLIVTDYSSAAFDFAYLRKPIVYCQFDKEYFFSGVHMCTAGYFDYERDGFGEVEYDLDGTIDRIIEYMQNGCQLKEKYRQRIDHFFAFQDKNNCRRVYEKILELNDQE